MADNVENNKSDDKPYILHVSLEELLESGKNCTWDRPKGNTAPESSAKKTAAPVPTASVSSEPKPAAVPPAPKRATAPVAPTPAPKASSPAPQQVVRKYMLMPGSITVNGRTMFQICAVRDLPAIGVKKGDYGGYVESDRNLSHSGNCWIFDSAGCCDRGRVFGDATLHNHAIVKDDAVVRDRATVCGNAVISDWGLVKDYGFVGGTSRVYDQSRVEGRARCYDDCRLYGGTIIKGTAECYNTSVSNICLDHGVWDFDIERDRWNNDR